MRESLPHNLQTECASPTSDTSCSALQKMLRSAILASAFVFPQGKVEAQEGLQQQAQETIEWLKVHDEVQLLFALEDDNYFVRKFASEELKERAIHQMRTTKRHISWEKYLGRGEDPERLLREQILKKEILPEQMWMGSYITEDFPDQLIGKPMLPQDCADHLTKHSDTLVQFAKGNEKVIIKTNISGMPFLEACTHIQSENGEQVFLRDQKNGIAKLELLRISKTKKLAYDNGLSACLCNYGHMQYIFLTSEGNVNIADWKLMEANGIGPKGEFPLMINHNYEKSRTFIGLDLPTASEGFDHIDIRIRITVAGHPFIREKVSYPLPHMIHMKNEDQVFTVTQGDSITDEKGTRHRLRSLYLSPEFNCDQPSLPEDDPFTFIAQRKDKTIIQPSTSLRHWQGEEVNTINSYKEKPHTITAVIEDREKTYESEKVLEFNNVPLYERKPDNTLEFTDVPKPSKLSKE